MPRIAIYPGSFDPATYGHMDIIERAAHLFDELVVAVGVNLQKKHFLTPEQRVQSLRESLTYLPNVKVDWFQGLLVDYAASQHAGAIVRGLRATTDFEYEFQMAMVNRRLTDKIETVFLMTKWDHSYLSSSIVREVAMYGGDISEMVPGPVKAMMELAIPDHRP